MTAYPAIPLSGEVVALAPTVLKAEDLTLAYGPTLAVDRVSLQVAKGERLVLLGQSGCGKSSILKALAGFLKPAGGQITLHGKPVTEAGPDRIVVFQEFDQLLPWKTVVQNVEFPLRKARKLSKAEARARAEDALERVGLTRALNSYPHELSGGMKQRAAIARALAMKPEVLLMDEPFAALDALTRERLQADLLRVAEETNVTLIFVTHSIDEAILIGTRLHLLSSHPGRTIQTIATEGVKPGDPAFTTLSREVHEILFEGEEVFHG